MHTWHFSEHLLAEAAVHVLALIYVGEQLDAAANYFFALWRQEDVNDPQLEHWRQATEVYAYVFDANAGAWRRFCQGLGVAPEALTTANYSGWFLQYCEEMMPANSPTAEELQARYPDIKRGEQQLVTADSLLASWQALLQDMTHHGPFGCEEAQR